MSNLFLFLFEQIYFNKWAMTIILIGIVNSHIMSISCYSPVKREANGWFEKMWAKIVRTNFILKNLK